MENIIDDIKLLEKEYGSLPFWSWNDKLEKRRLKKQIEEMKGIDMGGFFMHAREGLRTEYLSDEWFECVRASVAEAKRLGMKAWVYDENGWPSGFAGGKLLENTDCHAVYLHAVRTRQYPEDAYAVYEAEYGKAPVLIDEERGERDYLAVYVMTDPTYIDTLRGDVTEMFLAETHERYKELLGKDFGDAMPGFFTDEPQYYRGGIPFSKRFAEWFFDKYGYSVTEAIPALYLDFEGARGLRYDYWSLVNERFTEGFIKTIYDWCEENGAMVTGHCIEEVSCYWQMLFCGGIMPFYEYQHIPGIDHLTRRLRTVLPSKQLGSVCAQLGKKKALSEMYAACGWDVTPLELKRIAESQYACGVNIMCQHLYPYSERGTRKRDYPAHFSEHNPWQSYMKEFDTYFARLGAALSLGTEYADILVIHPIHSAYLDYTDASRIEGESSLARLDGEFESLYTTLSAKQIAYHLGDELIMRRHASVEGARLRVGECTYGTVIIPAMDQLDANTARLLDIFVRNGGRIYSYLGHKPSLVDGRAPRQGELDFLSACVNIPDAASLSMLVGDQPVRVRGEYSELGFMMRETEHGRLIYIVNKAEFGYTDVIVDITGSSCLERVELDSLKRTPCRGERTDSGCRLILDIDAGESYLLSETKVNTFLPPLPTPCKKYVSLDRTLELCEPCPNMLTLDRARVSFDGDHFSEERPIERIRDELLQCRYEGELYLCFDFEVRDLPKQLSAVIERGGVECIYVNGRVLVLGEDCVLENAFSLTDILKYISVGHNSLTVKLAYCQSDHVYDVLFGSGMETLRNSLTFDSEIEAITLVGDFCVYTDETPRHGERETLIYPEGTRFYIAERKQTVVIENIVEDGYPFFAGQMRVMQTVHYCNGEGNVLRLEGRYAVCEVSVNGRAAGKLMFERELDLSDVLKIGENTVTLCMTFGNRNLLGPHHAKEPEPLGVGTRDFDFEGGWKNGKCEGFYSGYNFVISGAKSV